MRIIHRIASSVRLTTFIVANFRRDLARWSLAQWQLEYQSVCDLREAR